MKKILFTFSVLFSLLMFVPQYGLTQESNISKKEQKKLDKEKKKQEKEAASLAAREEYAQILQDKQFVFMANTLAGDAGVTFSVTPQYNFLSVSGETVVFQFSFDGIVGWNGIGGLTVKGEIEDFRFDPGKSIKKPMKVNSRVKTNTHWGKPYFTLTVFEEGYASITMTLKSGTLNMTGQVVKPEDARIYTGTEILIDR